MAETDGRGAEQPSRYETYGVCAPRPEGSWTLSTLVPPARLFNSNGIRWGPDNRLWITEFNGEQVSRWDPASDELTIGSPMGAPLRGPDDVAFDSSGAYFVTETMNGRVTGRRSDGEYVVLLDDAPGANGITVDPHTDELYVDEMREGGRVLRVDRNQLGRYTVLADELAWCNAMEVSPLGELCFPQVFAGLVLGIDLSSGKLRVVAEDLRLPTAVKFDGRGRLVVAEAAAGVITAIDLDSGTRQTVAKPGPGIDNFAFDGKGNLYVSNYCEGRVEQYVDGAVRRRVSAGGLIGPYQLALMPDGTLVAADANTLVDVTPQGALVRRTRLLIDQEFVAVGVAVAGTNLLALSGAGDVFVLSDGNPARKLIAGTGDATAQYLSTTASAATALGTDGPVALVALAGGDVVEVRNSHVATDRVATGLDNVTAVDRSHGLLAACDETSGALVLMRDGARIVVPDLDHPQAVAVSHDGVYVAEAHRRRVVRVSDDGQRQETACSDLPLGMPVEGVVHQRRCSLLDLGDGRIAIGCDGDGSVRVLTHH